MSTTVYDLGLIVYTMLTAPEGEWNEEKSVDGCRERYLIEHAHKVEEERRGSNGFTPNVLPVRELTALHYILCDEAQFLYEPDNVPFELYLQKVRELSE